MILEIDEESLNTHKDGGTWTNTIRWDSCLFWTLDLPSASVVSLLLVEAVIYDKR